MVTLANLRSQSSRDLAQLAKSTGVSGWHQMRKEQLVQAILKLMKKQQHLELGSMSPAISRNTVSRTSGNSVPRINGKSNGHLNGDKLIGHKLNGHKVNGHKVNGHKSSAKSSEKPIAPRTVEQNHQSKSNGRKNEIVNGHAAKPIKTAISVTKTSVQASKPVAKVSGKPSGKNGRGPSNNSKNGESKSSLAANTNAARLNPKKPVVAPTNGHEVNLRKPTVARIPASSPVATPSAIAAQIQHENDRREELKNLALSALVAKENRMVEKDRLILIVRDSHWLQTYWEITEATIRRARAALEKNWRGAKPVLRLLEIVDDGDGPTEVVRREIEIHSGVDTWYIDSGMPSRTYRVMIGYLTSQGRFFALAKSNKVTTPSPGTPAPQDHWADIANHYESYFAMSGGFTDDNESRDLQDVFEEKLRRPVKALSSEHARMIDHRSDFRFEVDAQMVIFGIADPGAVVSVGGEPLRIEENGTFSIRVDMPDKRQVFPVVACSRDGAHQRTTVLAIERNTKVMDPVHMECDDA